MQTPSQSLRATFKRILSQFALAAHRAAKHFSYANLGGFLKVANCSGSPFRLSKFRRGARMDTTTPHPMSPASAQSE